MFFLERKEPVALPNILGGTSQPVHTHRWKAIYTCPERWPLEAMLRHMDPKTHRITSNSPAGGSSGRERSLYETIHQ